MSLIIISAIVIIFFYLTVYLIGSNIEVRVPETHLLNKWWRKHMLDVDPNEPKDGENIY
jgi:hypothetical protein